MAQKRIVLDLETQNSFADVGGRGNNKLLKVSVCGVYFYETDKYEIFEEKELAKLSPLLASADEIIGFNIIGFDFQVLQPYLNFDIYQVPHLDIMAEIDKVLGHRLSLETVAQATLGSGKSGKGTDAIMYFRQGRMEELKRYCLDDVRVTKEVYEYALKNNKILYSDFATIKEIPMKIKLPEARTGVKVQESLF